MNDPPYEGWPSRPPEGDAEKAGEDSMSQMVRLGTADAYIVKDAKQRGRNKGGSVLDTRSFVIGARNTQWGEGGLDLQFYNLFMPHKGISRVRHRCSYHIVSRHSHTLQTSWHVSLPKYVLNVIRSLHLTHLTVAHSVAQNLLTLVFCIRP